MVLSPLQKFLVIVVAGVVQGFVLIWAGIKVDAFALGLNENLYNIVAIVLTIANSGVVALLVILGLRSPTDDDAIQRSGNILHIGEEYFTKIHPTPAMAAEMFGDKKEPNP